MACIACGRSAEPLHVVPLTPPAADHVKKLCDTLGPSELARTRAVFDREAERERATRSAEGLDELTSELPALFASCFDDADGAWLVTLDWMKSGTQWGPSLDARWSLTHIGRDGTKVSVAPGMLSDNIQSTESNLLLGGEDSFSATLQPFDYDNDGRLEIIVTLSGKAHEGPDWARGRIYSVRDGQIKIYPPAEELIIERIDDVDHDGRPDVITHADYITTENSCGSGFQHRLVGPEFVAHANPDGSFSLTDPIASLAARAECPRPPLPRLSRNAGSPTEIDVVCARVWGATADAVAVELARACPTAVGGDTCAIGQCDHRSTLDIWASYDPPLTLTN